MVFHGDFPSSADVCGRGLLNSDRGHGFGLIFDRLFASHLLTRGFGTDSLTMVKIFGVEFETLIPADVVELPEHFEWPRPKA